MPMNSSGVVAALIVLLLGCPAAAPQTPGGVNLAAIKSLKCVFPVYATGTWVNGEPKAEVKAATLSVQFDTINTDEGTARSNTGFGPLEIVTRLSGGHLHFLQIDTGGPLYVTTVFDKETRGGKLQAVHTRHEYTLVSLPGFTSRPEQYYGECEPAR